MSRSSLFDRSITIIERASAALLALVTALTFISVALRYLLRWSIPDAYDLSRNLLGILIFWGIALACHRGGHITVDLLWGAMSRRWQRIVDAGATVFSTACMLVFAWMMAEKVIQTQASAETTYDLQLPLWPFQLLACTGLVASVPLLLARLVRTWTAADESVTPPGQVSH